MHLHNDSEPGHATGTSHDCGPGKNALRISSCAYTHLTAEGGIFWCYGLVTFARFLGAFSDLGWAWNRAPTGDPVSAEFVESFVIFFYGATNTWMERFGAQPGDPYTTKQLQHISIAVMFWFAGLVGMGIESRRVRRWLAPPAHGEAEPRAETPLNPFPALVIGVTGAAMSAHFQTYVFQVQIHMLWGYLLCGFAAMRCLTYFFLWLAPPRSILPSRPPTKPSMLSYAMSCASSSSSSSTCARSFVRSFSTAAARARPMVA